MNFEISKDDLHTTRVVHAEPAPLAEGQARLGVRRFGFSANNITYAVFGDLMGYWSFFPSDEGWGSYSRLGIRGSHRGQQQRARRWRTALRIPANGR